MGNRVRSRGVVSPPILYYPGSLQSQITAGAAAGSYIYIRPGTYTLTAPIVIPTQNGLTINLGNSTNILLDQAFSGTEVIRVGNAGNFGYENSPYSDNLYAHPVTGNPAKGDTQIVISNTVATVPGNYFLVGGGIVSDDSTATFYNERELVRITVQNGHTLTLATPLSRAFTGTVVLYDPRRQTGGSAHATPYIIENLRFAGTLSVNAQYGSSYTNGLRIYNVAGLTIERYNPTGYGFGGMEVHASADVLVGGESASTTAGSNSRYSYVFWGCVRGEVNGQSLTGANSRELCLIHSGTSQFTVNGLKTTSTADSTDALDFDHGMGGHDNVMQNCTASGNGGRITIGNDYWTGGANSPIMKDNAAVMIRVKAGVTGASLLRNTVQQIQCARNDWDDETITMTPANQKVNGLTLTDNTVITPSSAGDEAAPLYITTSTTSTRSLKGTITSSGNRFENQRTTNNQRHAVYISALDTDSLVWTSDGDTFVVASTHVPIRFGACSGGAVYDVTFINPTFDKGGAAKKIQLDASSAGTIRGIAAADIQDNSSGGWTINA